jgi:homoserine kinase type II
MADYTTVDQIDPRAIAKDYDLVDPQITPLAGGTANSSFRVSDPTGDYVLTVLDNHDLPSARRLAVHTRALHELGIPTSEVVPASGRELVTTIGTRPMLLKRWIAGQVKQPFPLPLLPAAGRVLAQLHQLPVGTAGLTDVPTGTRDLSPAQRALIPKFTDQDFATWLTERLDDVRRVERTRPPDPRIIHGDLFDDNIIVGDDGQLSILDWETLSIGDSLLDVGMAAVGLAQENGLLASERLHAFLAGYSEITPISDRDRAALPSTIIHAALIIAFHRYYRHNVRFPDPRRNKGHLAMIKFVESVDGGF